MKKYAITIVLNGAHHLLFKNLVRQALEEKHFDYWVFVEGATLNKGSTKWCKPFPRIYAPNGHSIDGTRDILGSLQSEFGDRMRVVTTDRFWQSKDEMINEGMKHLAAAADFSHKCYLFQVDVDEHWTKDKIEQVICEMNVFHSAASFRQNFYVADRIALGRWGEGGCGYRVWRWYGEAFASHEPPLLARQEYSPIVSKVKFDHHAYLFVQDVAFKDEWYTGHEGILKRWEDILSTNVESIPTKEFVPGYGLVDDTDRLVFTEESSQLYLASIFLQKVPEHVRDTHWDGD